MKILAVAILSGFAISNANAGEECSKLSLAATYSVPSYEILEQVFCPSSYTTLISEKLRGESVSDIQPLDDGAIQILTRNSQIIVPGASGCIYSRK